MDSKNHFVSLFEKVQSVDDNFTVVEEYELF